ncbi:MAG: hypothetical protein ACTSVA_05840 [Candidatus Njordarchaeales archaeon]
MIEKLIRVGIQLESYTLKELIIALNFYEDEEENPERRRIKARIGNLRETIAFEASLRQIARITKKNLRVHKETLLDDSVVKRKEITFDQSNEEELLLEIPKRVPTMILTAISLTSTYQFRIEMLNELELRLIRENPRRVIWRRGFLIRPRFDIRNMEETIKHFISFAPLLGIDNVIMMENTIEYSLKNGLSFKAPKIFNASEEGLLRGLLTKLKEIPIGYYRISFPHSIKDLASAFESLFFNPHSVYKLSYLLFVKKEGETQVYEALICEKRIRKLSEIAVERSSSEGFTLILPIGFPRRTLMNFTREMEKGRVAFLLPIPFSCKTGELEMLGLYMIQLIDKMNPMIQMLSIPLFLVVN